MNPASRKRTQEALIKAFEAGEILACRCPVVDAWVYETVPPDFQASISCACDAMRPLFSSTPETEE